MASSSTFTTPPLAPDCVSTSALSLHSLPSPALKPRTALLLPPKSFATDGSLVKSKTASRLPDRWAELSDDVYHLVAEHVPTRHLPALQRTSQRWRTMIESAWEAICTHRFPPLASPLAVPSSVLWAIATRGDEDDAIGAFLRTLGGLQREWPDCVSASCEGMNNRLAELRGRARSLWMPADVAIFYVMGALSAH